MGFWVQRGPLGHHGGHIGFRFTRPGCTLGASRGRHGDGHESFLRGPASPSVRESIMGLIWGGGGEYGQYFGVPHVAQYGG